MAVLVSGASGFLGSRLVERLVAAGHDVVGVSRRPPPEKFTSHPRIQWLVRDIAQEGLDNAQLPHLDAAVHLAGATLGAGVDEHLFMRANEQTTVRLLQALSGRIEHFVFASSQAVYGNALHLGVTEDFPLQPESSAYACSKVNSENWMRWFRKRHGGRYLALRLCGFIDGGGIVDYLIDRALAGEPIELYFGGAVRRDYLPSAEGIDALMAAVNYRGEPGFTPVNVGSGQLLSALELAKIVCAELGSSSRIDLSAAPGPQGDFVLCVDRARQMFDFRPGQLADAVRRHARDRRAETRRAGDAKN